MGVAPVADRLGMEIAAIPLHFDLRQRALTAYSGAMGWAAGVALAIWVLVQAMFHPIPWTMIPFLAIAMLVATSLVAMGKRAVTCSWSEPTLYLDDTRLIIDDPLTLGNLQSIPRSLIESIYFGPAVPTWLVAAYGTTPDASTIKMGTHLGRIPQLPNMLVVLRQPVLLNQARRRLFRLWHLSLPPSPKRPTKALWATVEDEDAAHLICINWTMEPSWASVDSPLPVI